MAGYNYSFHKAFGFRLDERWGKHRFSLTTPVRQARATHALAYDAKCDTRHQVEDYDQYLEDRYAEDPHGIGSPVPYEAPRLRSKLMRICHSWWAISSAST